MKRKSRKSWIISGAIVSLLLIIVLSIVLSSPQQAARERLPFSSSSPKFTGTKALALLLKERGLNVQEWNEEYYNLPSNSSQSTLFTIEPFTNPPTPSEMEGILKWVEQGNQWVLFASPDTEWHEELSFDTERCYFKDLAIVDSYSLLDQNPWFEEIYSINWGRDCVVPTSYDTTLLSSMSGKDLVVMRQYGGKGRIVYVPYSKILSNEQIAQVDNIALPLGLLEGYSNNIWFDETVHPYLPGLDQSAYLWEEDQPEMNQDFSLRSFFSMIQLNGLFVVLQLAIAVLFWLWWKGKRFAPARREVEIDLRVGNEHVVAMGRWLKKNSSRKQLLNYTFQKLQHDIKEKLGLPNTIDEQKLLENMEEKLDTSFLERYKQAKNSLDKINNQNLLFESEYVSISKALIELRKEMNQWRTKWVPLNISKKFQKRSFKL